MSKEKHFFVGNLLAPRWHDRPVQPAWEIIPNIAKNANESVGWCSYLLTTEKALVGEHEETNEQGKFAYRFLVRQSDFRFLLACTAKEVLEYVTRIADLENRVTPPTINIAALVEMLVDRPKNYTLSTVYARIDGFGQAFRSISMYGSDLADAKLFRDIAPQIAPYRVTLRDQIYRDDVLTISSRGEVSFVHRGPQSLRQVDEALRFLAKHEFMNWDLE
ncbi:hypothetical protein ACH50O_21020 [Methylomonas sp. 2BW1-5-20]|uniref:hypothetical protein n=1 Tax=Methylomonas sp. 2BW1-5-20 TaxID=3376686 RepID=UPI004051BAD5